MGWELWYHGLDWNKFEGGLKLEDWVWSGGWDVRIGYFPRLVNVKFTAYRIAISFYAYTIAHCYTSGMHV